MKTVLKHAVLALCGGCVYYAIEILWRGHSHWTMALVGGACFVLIGCINEFFTWEMSLLEQGVIGASIITVLEFVSGIILNLQLCMGIWDYSNMPMNVMGQICLPYSLLWVPLAILAAVADDWLRFWLFKEEKPNYRII